MRRLDSRSDRIGPGYRELRRLHGNGVVLSYLNATGTAVEGYDGVKRLTRERLSTSGGASLIERAYAYNRANVRRGEQRFDDSGVTDTFSYDSLYRVVSARYDEGGTASAARRATVRADYTLDGAGNRRFVVSQDAAGAEQTEAYSVNSLNEYTRKGSASRVHDLNGNLLDDGTLLYAYDFKNRLSKAFRKSDGALVAEYFYDCENRRIEKRVHPAAAGVPPGTTRFLYDGWSVCEERDGADTPLATFVCHLAFGLDEVVQIQRTAAHASGAGTIYLHQNARSDVIAVTDSTGSLAEKTFYDDFGRALDAAKQVKTLSLVGNPYGFQGRRLDGEVGLYYFRNRHYDPASGRFLQRDPVWDSRNVGNQYSFGNASPLSVSDPMGTEGFFDDMAELGGIVADIGEATYDFAAEVVEDGWDRATETYDMVRKAGYNPLAAGALAVADVVLSETGAYDMWSAKEGYDVERLIRTGEYKKLSDAERVYYAGAGFLKFGMAAWGGAGALSKARCLVTKGPGGRCFVAGTLVSTAAGFVEIERLRLGQRVLALEEGAPAEERIEPSEWAVVALTMPNPDGSDDELEIELLRPKAWLAANLDRTTRTIALSLPELQLEGDAAMQEIKPCPAIEAGPGRVVTATFTHENSYVLRVEVEVAGRLEVLQPTRQHPFYVVGEGWTRADALEAQDVVRTVSGEGVVVSCTRGVGVRQRVFNLEVEGSHTYYVGASGVLVHNSYATLELPIDNILSQGASSVNRHRPLRRAGSKIQEGMIIKAAQKANRAKRAKTRPGSKAYERTVRSRLGSTQQTVRGRDIDGVGGGFFTQIKDHTSYGKKIGQPLDVLPGDNFEQLAATRRIAAEAGQRTRLATSLPIPPRAKAWIQRRFPETEFIVIPNN